MTASDRESAGAAAGGDRETLLGRDRQRVVGSLLWGVVGALAFLVLLQAYRLFGGVDVSLPVAALGALVAGGAAAVGTYQLDRLLSNRKGSA